MKAEYSKITNESDANIFNNNLSTIVLYKIVRFYADLPEITFDSHPIIWKDLRMNFQLQLFNKHSV